MRRLSRRPTFVAVAAVTLAACLGVDCALISFYTSIVVRPQPGLQAPAALAQVLFQDQRGALAYPSPQDFQLLRNLRPRAASFAYYEPAFATIGVAGSASHVLAEYVSPEYFQVLDVQPARGRLLAPIDTLSDHAESPVVISWRLWHDQFGASDGVLGLRCTIGGAPGYRIVGITSRGFHGPEGLVQADVYLVRRDTAASAGPGRIVARLRAPGRTGLAQTRAELTVLWTRVRAIEAERAAVFGRHLSPKHFTVTALRGGLHPEQNWAVHALLGGTAAVALLLLVIAVINVGSLTLARTIARNHELVTRRALGASAGNLFVGVLFESLIVFGIGGLGALGVASAAGQILVRALNTPYPFVLPVTFDPWTLAALLALTLTSAFGCALFALYRCTRVQPAEVLRGDGVSASGGRRVRAVQSMLVSLQGAAALALLAGSSALLLGIRAQSRRASGVADPGTLYVEATPPAGLDSARRSVAAVVSTALIAAGRARSVATAYQAPGFGQLLELPLGTAPQPRDDGRGPPTPVNLVTPGYFNVLGTPLLRGREFAPSDAYGSARVAIVSRAAAAALFHDEHAVGRYLYVGDTATTPTLIVGEAPDIVYDVDHPAVGAVHLPAAQVGGALGYRQLVVRATAANAGPAIDSVVVKAEPRALGSRAQTAEDIMALQTAGLHSALHLVLAASALALALCTLGLFGVISHNVSTRSREIGVRVALGARTSQILRHFARSALWIAGGAVFLGTALFEFARGMLPETVAAEPRMMGGSLALAAVIVVATILVSAIAAVLRHSHVDPRAALMS